MSHTRSKDPRVVEVILPGLNKQHLEVVVQVRQPVDISLRHEGKAQSVTHLPATTHPQLPPPHTIISNSSGRGDILDVLLRSSRARKTDVKASRLTHIPARDPSTYVPRNLKRSLAETSPSHENHPLPITFQKGPAQRPSPSTCSFIMIIHMHNVSHATPDQYLGPMNRRAGHEAYSL